MSLEALQKDAGDSHGQKQRTKPCGYLTTSELHATCLGDGLVCLHIGEADGGRFVFNPKSSPIVFVDTSLRQRLLFDARSSSLDAAP